MKRKHTLRSLLSMVCTIAMIISLVPVLPAAAADDLLYDNMESYTVGTDLYSQAGDKYSQKSASWNAVKDAGGTATVVADPLDSKNKVVALTTPEGDSKRYVLSTVPVLNGDYTVQFDYMPGDVEANPGSGFMDVYVNQGNQHMARIASSLYNTYFNLDKTGCSNVVKNAELDMKNIWYSVRIVVTASKYVMDIWEKGNEDNMFTCTTTKGTKAINNAHVEFCIGPYLESQGVNTSAPITNYIDNIRITSGVVEAGAPEETEDGVSVSGGGMVEFVDEYGIVNKEAVAVTAGMGIFSGKEGNRFDPYGELTRAEMATVIVKMLRGNAFNADNFKGVDTFSDTAGYQGGWAEGYINACVEMGIVKGYGDGTFKPGNPVNTAEALTMIINALKVDAGEGEWPSTIMAKAQEMKLYGDLATKPDTYEVLTRDELAVLVYEGMNYSPSGATGWMIPGTDIILDNYKDAASACTPPERPIEVKGKDSLVSKVYEMKIAEGYIVANQETSDAEYTTILPIGGTGINFNMKTRLDQIGHYVSVYYREEFTTEKNPGVVYNYVDKTEVITVDETITNDTKDYKEAFGTNTALASSVARFDSTYTFTGFGANTGASYTAGRTAAAGTYFVYEGQIIGYMQPVPVYAARVRSVNDLSDSESITLSYPSTPISNTKDKDRVVEYDGIAKDDYVTYTVVGTGDDAIYVLNKADMARGIVTKSATNKDGDNVITVGGAEYVQFAGSNANEQNMITEFQAASNRTEVFPNAQIGKDVYEIYVTIDGKYVAYEAVQGTVNLDQTAFILGEVTVVGEDSYGKVARKTYARGVDLNGNEVMLLMKVEKNGEVWSDGTFAPSLNANDTYADPANPTLSANTFYTYEASTDTKAQKEDIYLLEAYPASYNKDNGDLVYSGTRSFNDNVAYALNNFTCGGMNTQAHSGTKYMLLEGTVDQLEPLTGTMKTSWSTATNSTGATMYHYYLLSRDASNHQMMDVAIVVVSQNTAAASGAQVVYVSEANRTPIGTDTNGYVYEVYDYLTGAKKQITVSKNDPKLGASGVLPEAGYWEMLTDEKNEALSVLVGKVTDSPNFSYSTSNSSSQDGLYYENILHDQKFVELANDELTTTGTTYMTRGKKAGAATVVDTRTEAEIEASGIGKIKSVDRIATLALDNPEIDVTFDLCYSSKSSALMTLFITDVKYTSVGAAEFTKSGSTYYLDGRVIDTNNVTINDLSGRLNGTTTTDKLNDLIAQSASNTITVSYDMAGGKVSAITVESIALAGELFFVGFDNYADGENYTDSVVTGTTDSKYTSITTETLDDGTKALQVTAKGNSSSAALYAGNKVAGSFIWETRMKRINTDGYTKLYSTDLKNRKTAANTLGSFQLHIQEGGVSMYRNSAAGGSTTVCSGINTNQWLTVRVTVYNELGTTANDYILTQIYDDAGTLLGELKEAGDDYVSVSTENRIGFDVRGGSATADHTIAIDYIKVSEFAVAPVSTYSVTTTPAANGLINVVGSATEGAEVTVNTTAKPGYKVDSITVTDALGNPVAVTDGKFTMPPSDVNVTAAFTPLAEVTVTITGTDATITLTDEDGNPVASGDTVLEGTVLTVEANPVDSISYALGDVYANGNKMTESTYTVGTVDVTFTADVRAYKFYTVTTGTCNNGSVAFIHNGIDGTGANAGKVREGATVTVTGSAASGYELATVYVNGEGITGTTFVLGEDTAASGTAKITAFFKAETTLFYDDFSGYNEGDFALGGTIAKGSNYGGNVTHKIDKVGELTVTATGGSGNRGVVRANTKLSGSYTVEARIKATPTSNNYTMVYLSNVKFPRSQTKSGSTTYSTIKYDLRLQSTGNAWMELNAALAAGAHTSSIVGNKLTGGVDTANKMYLYANGNPNNVVSDTAAVKFTPGNWYTIKIIVDDTNDAVTTELYDASGALVGSRTLFDAVIGEGYFEIECFYTSTTVIDYIMITQ